jgi:DNA (cytosine-5)-methyltransferase 1
LYYTAGVNGDMVVRKLHPRECARLQGFPETFQLPNSRTQAWQQFGNSVPVPIVEAVTKAMLRHIS